MFLQVKKGNVGNAEMLMNNYLHPHRQSGSSPLWNRTLSSKSSSPERSDSPFQSPKTKSHKQFFICFFKKLFSVHFFYILCFKAEIHYTTFAPICSLDKSMIVAKIHSQSVLELTYDGHRYMFSVRLWLYLVKWYKTCFYYLSCISLQQGTCFCMSLQCSEWFESLVVCDPQSFSIRCPVFLCNHSQSR